MKANEPLALNSATGKSVLAMIREGCYAHPGEEEAIELVFSGFRPRSGFNILDLGCGLGGTAQYIQDKGWGRVIGVDIDEESVEAARDAFPECQFQCADAEDLSIFEEGQFDLVVLFSSYYAFECQNTALNEISRVLKSGGLMLLFDYAALQYDFSDKAKAFISSRAHSWKPIVPQQIGYMLRVAEMDLESYVDLSDRFESWYDQLLNRIAAKKERIIKQYGSLWYDHVHNTYSEILNLIRLRILGGALVSARKQ